METHALTVKEIKEVVDKLAHAARLAVKVAEFDGVEIHGANGYLLDSFVHDNINTGSDEYVPSSLWMALLKRLGITRRLFALRRIIFFRGRMIVND